MYLLEVMQLQWENIDGAIAKAKLVSTLLFLSDLKTQFFFMDSERNNIFNKYSYYCI